MRKFQPKKNLQDKPIGRPELRLSKPAGIYARRSDPYAKDKKKDRSQSREMQTGDLIEWGQKKGWSNDDLYPYFADLGLSGTLRPDQRPDMLRLFDDIDDGKFDHGSIICFQENRLFRDETQIYYNQFIDKCLQHDINIIVISPSLVIYELRDEFSRERLREKLKEASEFIPRHIKGWLLPAKERAAWEYGEWAGIGDINMGYIVDFDEHSLTYKKRIPYQPHADIIRRELFEAFAEVGGDIGLLNRKIAVSPVIFPFFEPWVDRRIVSKFSKWSTCSRGYILQHGNTVRSILTNPVYIGYQMINGVIRHDEHGKMITSHEAIIDRELFNFAFYKLSKFDLDGTPLEAKQIRRYYYRGDKAEYGLLKFRIRWSNGPVRTQVHGEYEEDKHIDRHVYILAPEVFKLGSRNYMSVPCEEVDTIVIKRLMEHIHELSIQKDDIAAYENQAREVREIRKKKIRQIQESILSAENEQKRLTIALGQVKAEKKDIDIDIEQVNERLQALILEQIKNLELERIKLFRDKKGLEEEADNDIGPLEEELIGLEKLWPKYTFSKRQSLINFLIKDVLIDFMSTHWVRIRVTWLHEGWGTEEFYYARQRGRQNDWTLEEDAIIQTYYATAPKAQLMALLPDRAWRSIQMKGWLSGIKRKLGSPAKEEKTVVVGEERIVVVGNDWSHSDIVFLHSMNLPLSSQCIKWTAQRGRQRG